MGGTYSSGSGAQALVMRHKSGRVELKANGHGYDVVGSAHRNGAAHVRVEVSDQQPPRFEPDGSLNASPKTVINLKQQAGKPFANLDVKVDGKQADPGLVKEGLSQIPQLGLGN